jgi:hypothetical protein
MGDYNKFRLNNMSTQAQEATDHELFQTSTFIPSALLQVETS